MREENHYDYTYKVSLFVDLAGHNTDLHTPTRSRYQQNVQSRTKHLISLLAGGQLVMQGFWSKLCYEDNYNYFANYQQRSKDTLKRCDPYEQKTPNMQDI